MSQDSADTNMAPMQKTAPSNKADKGSSVPLEGPVSLLWAYQLRREHTLLLGRIDSLADSTRNEDAAAQIRSLTVDLEAQGGRIAVLEKEQNSDRLDMQAIQARASSGDEAVSAVQLKLVAYEKQYRESAESVVAEQERMKLSGCLQSNQIAQVRVEIEAAFKSRIKEQQGQILLLESKIVELEGRFMESAGKEVTVVRDSIEDVPATDFDKPQLVNASDVLKRFQPTCHKGFSRANDLLQRVNEQRESDMLALGQVQHEETPATEIDLDAGLTTMSYARHLWGRKLPENSMAMLPELQPPTKKQSGTTTEEDICLRQGPTQSWHQYLRKGRDLIKSSRKRQEGTIVDTFVAGIADPSLRAGCTLWLDERLWIWRDVETFAAQCKLHAASTEPSSTEEPNPRQQRAVEDEVPRRVGDIQAVSKELARLLEDQSNCSVQPCVVTRIPKPDGIRRSRRIAKKIDNIRQQAQDGPQVIQERHEIQVPVQRPKEHPKQAPKQRQKAIKKAKPLTKPVGNAQVQSVCNRTASPMQTAVPIETEAHEGSDQPGQAALLVKPKQSATRVVLSQIWQPDVLGGDIYDPSLHAKARKLCDTFPNVSSKLCNDALVKNMGDFDRACEWIANRTPQLQKPDRQDIIRPSSPASLDGVSISLTHAKAIDQSPDPYETPEHHMIVGPQSLKRKVELSEPEPVAKRKRARMAKKRGPAPPIPVLPSSDTE